MNISHFNIILVLFYFTSITAQTESEHSSCCSDSTCVQERIQELLALLSVGITKNDQIVSINPIRHNGPFTFHANASVFKYMITTTNNSFGFVGSQVSDVRISNFHGPDVRINFTTQTPHFTHTANYKMIGSVDKKDGINDNIITLKETGVAIFSADNVVFQHYVTLRVQEEDGVEIVRLLSYTVHLQHSDSVHADYTNLFGVSNKSKAAKFSQLLNKHFGEILQSFMQEVNEDYALLFADIARQVVDGTPRQQFCPNE